MEIENNEPKININNDTQEIAEEQHFQNNYSTVSQTYSTSQGQLHWTNRQVTHLERQLLLNSNTAVNYNFMSNWTKVILSALAVIIPGVGQLAGIIIGLIFVSNDLNSDKRSFGAALLTVSLIVFVLTVCIWFILAVSLGPLLY